MKTKIILTALALGASAWMASAQDDGAKPPGGLGQGAGQGQRPLPPLVAALDANHDGTIDAGEINNASAALKTLDKNSDGKLTREELMPARPEGGRPDGARPEGGLGQGGYRKHQGPPGQGGDQQRPPRAQDQLKLTDEQQKQIEAIQAETKAKMDKVLTPEQLEQIKNMRPPMRQGGPGRFGGPGMPGGPGGPGGQDRPEFPPAE
jgi:Spy/CpxP family protein refolding chaperone